MRYLSLILLLFSLPAWATTYTVNSGQSEATIQGVINGATSGDTVSFTAGTYSLASNGGNPNNAAFNLKAGITYTGPASGSPAILAGTGLYPMMYFGSTTVSILHFTFNNGFIFFDDHTTGATVDNNVFTNMPVCNTTASQTSAIYIAGGINNSDISFNTFSHIGDNCNNIPNDSQGAGGIVFFAFHNLTITNNVFDNVREGIDVPISTGGSYDCAGGVFTNNTFTNIVRIGIELLGSSTKPSGLSVAFNTFSLPLNPYFASFGYSLTAGQNMIFHDNGSNSNSVSGATGPYGVEIAGNGTQAYNNTVEGKWALGFAIGNTGGPISITNNNICGPNMNANPSSGSTPSVGNSNGFISWEGSSQGGTFTGNTTSSSLTCGTPTVATPTYSPVAGTYTGTQSVAISTVTPGTSIVYTNNGTTPTVTALTCTITNGTLYTGAVSVSTSQTLNAIGCKLGSNASSVATAVYVINIPAVANPTCIPGSGVYVPAQTVTCSTVTSGAIVCGTIDGSTPTATTPGTCSHGTSGPFTISISSSINVLGTKSGDTNSSVVTVPYVITGPTLTNFTGTSNITNLGVN